MEKFLHEIKMETKKSLEKDLTFDLDLYDEYPKELIPYKHNQTFILIHAVEHYGALKDFSELHNEINKKLCAIDIAQTYAIQSFSLQNLVHGMDCFIVSPEKTGRTWSYLPALCNFLRRKLISSHDKSSVSGPIAIIVVKCLDKLIIVSNICNYLLEGVKLRLCTVSTSDRVQKLNNCDVIVSLVGNLSNALNKDKNTDELNLSRLKYLVFDDIDVLETQSDVKYEHPLCAAILSLYERLPKNADEKLNLQMVVTSSSYSSLIENLFLMFARNPLLIIGDPFEAALYGGTEIVMRKCHKRDKMKLIAQFIEEHPLHRESLFIICECDQDAFYVSDELRSMGIMCLVAHSKTPTQMRQKIKYWDARPNKLQVRIFTDDAMLELQICNADNVIHFSLGDSWHKFSLRFVAILFKHKNLILTETDKSRRKSNSSEPVKRTSASCLILVDMDLDLSSSRFDVFSRRLKKFLPKDEANVDPSMVLSLERLNLKTTESWNQLPFRKLVLVKSETTTRGDWKDVFVQRIPNENSSKFDKLHAIVQEHINFLKRSEVSKEFDLGQLTVGKNVIVKHNGQYFRAKLHSVQGAIEKCYYWFFLCDEAVFKFIYTKNLLNDFLYPTTKGIVEFMPFRNIYCKLVGIHTNNLSKYFKCAGRLYAYAISKGIPEALVGNTGINCYEILLFEEQRSGTSTKFSLVNKKLLQLGAASDNFASRNYLNINIDNIIATL